MAAVRLASLALSILLALGLAGFGLAISWSQLRGPSTADTLVVLPRGMGLAAIADSLEQQGVVGNAPLFSLWLRLSGRASDLRAGEYRFPAGASGADVANILVKGLTYKRRLTVPEGIATARALTLIAEAPALQGPIPADTAEGALLPETYQYEWGDARAALVARMHRAQTDLLAVLWPQRTDGLPLQSPEQALVLASIVERETGVAEERARIAGVFINRLRRGMRLQSDPTVEYGLRLRGRPEGQPLTRDDLESDTPYNTYRIRGLPPGPIANPGRAAIEAVLRPAVTDELYFVADGTGGHAFAVTLEDHNRNVARYRALRTD